MTSERQSRRGGVNISGTVGSIGGDLVGGDKSVTIHQSNDFDQAFNAVSAAIAAAPAAVRTEAEAKLSSLKQEVAKGKDKADDGVMGKLVDGLIGLVPAAASAVVGAFATPLLGGIAGPVTKFVLDKIRGT